MSERSQERLDWSWLRDFLVVAEEGSLSEAARRLGLSQPTLTRRMAAFEKHLGVELLRRGPRGIELTETGEAILQPVRRMRDEVGQVDLAAVDRNAGLSGIVRVSATEGLANFWCTPVLREFQVRHPAIAIEVDVSNRNANLLRREADIAIRLGRPRQPELVARRLGELRLGLYAATGYLDRRGRPQRPEDLAGHDGVGFDESIRDTGVGAWMEEQLQGGHVVFRSTSLMTQLQALRFGWGIGTTSIFLGEETPGIERVLPEVGLTLDVWLVTHPGLRRSARIRAVYDFLVERFADDRERLAGRG